MSDKQNVVQLNDQPQAAIWNDQKLFPDIAGRSMYD
jgi:hypothetical protein